MGSLIGDVKLSARQLAKAPGFTVAAVVVLSLGIGLNAAMFSLVYALSFMGRPYADPDRVVQLYSSQVKQVDSYRAFSYAAYREIAAQRAAVVIVDVSGKRVEDAEWKDGLNEDGTTRWPGAPAGSRSAFLPPRPWSASLRPGYRSRSCSKAPPHRR